MLSSSSTSSQFPSSSERETGREGDKLDRVPSSSSSSSINFVPEMGHGSAKNKQNNGDWVPNGAVSPSKKDQKQDHSSKLLTLPTVLTLARVAAVPVFIGSTFSSSILSFGDCVLFFVFMVWK